MIRFSPQATGNSAMLLYALITALSSILIHAATQTVTPLLSACYTFLFCLLVYLGQSLSIFKRAATIKRHVFSIFMLNITTAVCWIFTFLALKYLPPDLYLFVYLGAMPISGAIIFRTKILKAIILFLCLILLIYTYHNMKLLPGILLAFIGGTSGTIYSIYSKRLTEEFTTTEILSLRFYLTVIITFVLCITFGEWKLLSPVEYAKFASLSFISVIIPLTLFQVGLRNLSIVKALSYMPWAPLLCYIVSVTLGYGEFSILQAVSVFFLFITMFA